MEQTEKKNEYRIGECSYRLEPLSWQQNKWLADHVFTNIDMERLDFAAVWDLFREKGPLIMSISLVDVGMSRADHSRRTLEDIQARAVLFAVELSGAEVAEFAPHFFQQCRPDQLAMLIPGKALQRQFDAARSAEAAPSPAPGGNGSNAVSSVSAAATSPSSAPSLPNGALVNPSPISGAVLSETPSTAPFLAGSV